MLKNVAAREEADENRAKLSARLWGGYGQLKDIRAIWTKIVGKQLLVELTMIL